MFQIKIHVRSERGLSIRAKFYAEGHRNYGFTRSSSGAFDILLPKEVVEKDSHLKKQV
jgi:hypothetical protein